jgi:HD-GYP domain-containing protein (c-di-GMP phosphodiesterase class II)
MVVARDVVNADGRLLVRNGVILNKRYIRRLRQLGIGSIYIRTPLDIELSVEEAVQAETKNKAVQTVKRTFETIKRTRVINAAEYTPLVEMIIDDLVRSRSAVLHMSDIRSYDDYTFGHSIHVSIYSTFVGMAMGYSELKLKELALGAMLHDVGKMVVPPDILNKPARLTGEEMEIVKRHAEAGFEILRKNGEISLVAAHVAFQHQERIRGGGYPRGLKGNEIHEYARITAIADVYDALTSDRPYRQGMLPHEAYEYMLSFAEQDFDLEILKLFFKRIALYPIGTIVTLNTGETAIVKEIVADLSLRPVVRVLVNHDGTLPAGKTEVDLTKKLTVFIERVCSEAEILTLYSRLGLDITNKNDLPENLI